MPAMHVTICAADEADFDEADRVIRAAFDRPVSFRPMLELHRCMQPDGLWLARQHGEIVGTVSCVDYGSLAYVGLMTVRPDCQRRGIARRLVETILDWLAARGCPCARLDATDAGAPLYERLGFVDDGYAFAYVRAATTAVHEETPSGAPLADLSIRQALEVDLPRVVALDQEAFGANRARLLTALWQADARGWFVADDSRGRLRGYLVARDPIIGPWAATDVTAAAALVRAALRQPRTSKPLVHVPRQNHDCRELLEGQGFVEQRRLRHMRRGVATPPSGQARIFGQSSFGHG